MSTVFELVLVVSTLPTILLLVAILRIAVRPMGPHAPFLGYAAAQLHGIATVLSIIAAGMTLAAACWKLAGLDLGYLVLPGIAPPVYVSAHSLLVLLYLVAAVLAGRVGWAFGTYLSKDFYHPQNLCPK